MYVQLHTREHEHACKQKARAHMHAHEEGGGESRTRIGHFRTSQGATGSRMQRAAAAAQDRAAPRTIRSCSTCTTSRCCCCWLPSSACWLATTSSVSDADERNEVVATDAPGAGMPASSSGTIRDGCWAGVHA